MKKNVLIVLILVLACFSCDKNYELKNDVPNQNEDTIANKEYEGLVSITKCYNNTNTDIKLTFWATSHNKIQEFLDDHTLSINPVFNNEIVSEATKNGEDRIINDISEFKTDLIIDYEILELDRDAKGFSVLVKSNPQNDSSKASFLYTTTHKSANDWVKGKVTHIPKEYSDDDIEVDWYYTKCYFCFWYHGTNEKLDNGLSSTYVGKTTYKIRAIVGYNYYHNYTITFMQP